MYLEDGVVEALEMEEDDVDLHETEEDARGVQFEMAPA